MEVANGKTQTGFDLLRSQIYSVLAIKLSLTALACRTMSPLPDQTNRKTNIPSVFDHECERPACADMQQMFQQQTQTLKQTNTKPASRNSENVETTIASPVVIKDEAKRDKLECPVNSSTLGRASWTLLHSMVREYQHCLMNAITNETYSPGKNA